MNYIRMRIRLRKKILKFLYDNNIKVTRITYRPNNPFPVSSEVIYKVLYPSQYHRKVLKKSLNKLNNFFKKNE